MDTRITSFIISAILLSAACAAPVAAASKTSKGVMSVSDSRFEQAGDSLYLDMMVYMSNINLGRRESIALTPVIKTEYTQTELPEILVAGKNRYKAFKRISKMHAKKIHVPYKVFAAEKNSDKSIRYTAVIPYETWMEPAELLLREDLWSCCEGIRMVGMDMIAPEITFANPKHAAVPVPYNPNMAASFIVPAAAAVKNRTEEGVIVIGFPVNVTQIRPAYMDNTAELAKMTDLINRIKNDGNLKITNINIIGYASPEGTYETNQNLSMQRAGAIKKYIDEFYAFDQRICTVGWGGENWDGLRTMVEQSDMRYKNEVLDIINNIGIFEGRELKLMLLKGGEPYKYMLSAMFPKLRYARYSINYEVRDFTTQESGGISVSDPAKLSLREFYDLANSYGSKTDKYYETFEISARMFPNDPAANNNAAAAALEKGDAVSAASYLQKAGNTPESLNNRGWLYMLQGNYADARKSFVEAVAAGSADGAANLEQLNIKEQNDEAIKAAESLE